MISSPHITGQNTRTRVCVCVLTMMAQITTATRRDL